MHAYTYRDRAEHTATITRLTRGLEFHAGHATHIMVITVPTALALVQ